MPTLFKEKQRFGDKLVHATLGLLCVATLIGSLQYLGESSRNLLDFFFLLTISLLSGGAIWWLNRLQLKLAVTEKKIKYKLSPLHGKKRTIAWKEVADYEVVRTSPAAQWSGANISFGPERRVTLSGRNGLALMTKSGDQYFIGCRNVEKLERVLKTQLK